MKTLSGRKSVEVSQFDIADASLLDALRGQKCYTGVNQMTKFRVSSANFYAF